MHFLPELNVKFIFEHVKEEEIWEAFGLKVQKEKFTAPYRTDNRPDCKFYRSWKNNRLYMHDYAGHFHGDCFDYVMFRGQCNFNEALHRVAIRFALFPSLSGDLVQRPVFATEAKIEKMNCSLKVKRLTWTDKHKAFWNRWDFYPSTLSHFNIAPVERVWLNDKPVFWYGYKSEIAFCYWFGDTDYKIYFPYRSEYRFLHNNPNILQGYQQLPHSGEILIITKSLKDVAKLYEFSISAVAPMAETQILTRDQFEDLSSRFKLILSLYDIDKLPGVRSMQQMKKLYGIKPLFFYSRMKKELQPKDFTDFYEKKGRETTLLLIEQVKDYLL